jgi:hypothetical protein
VRRENAGVCHLVIASEAKQSSFLPLLGKMDCFVASAFAPKAGFGGQEGSSQ